MKKIAFLLFCTILCFSCKEQKTLTVWMVGDSTMADRPDTIETPERGWGQVFPTYLSERVIVMNHAKNGRSTKSFLAEERWTPVIENIQAGDLLILQFGHNDAKVTDSTRYASPEEYKANLKRMVQEAKSKGASVILCTPIARRHFKNGELQYVHGDYPAMAKEVAREENIPLADLTATTMEWLGRLGDEGSQPYFVYIMQPGEYSRYPEGKTDNTHLRLTGALEVAHEFASWVKENNIKPLSDYILPDNSALKYTTPCGIK